MQTPDKNKQSYQPKQENQIPPKNRSSQDIDTNIRILCNLILDRIEEDAKNGELKFQEH